MLNFCVNCKFCRRTESLEFACVRTREDEIDRVTGKTTPIINDRCCYKERFTTLESACGEDGKFFVKKTFSDIFRRLYERVS